MMGYVSALPTGIRVVKTLDLCSNVLTGVEIPIAVGEYPVLLVGASTVPLIWLSVPEQPGATARSYVVAESQSNHPAVRITRDNAKREVEIKIGSVVVLRAQVSGASAVTVTNLDLTPLGLAVTGDKRGMKIGGATLANNRIQQARVGFALG